MRIQMSDLFQTDFYSPTVSFSVLPESERAEPYESGERKWVALGRTTAGIALAGVLFLAGPAVGSDPVIRALSLDAHHDHSESGLTALLQRRGDALPSPATAVTVAKALRARAFLEPIHPREPEAPDPDYGL
jgi:hypothetical protein